MGKFKNSIVLLTVFCIVTTGIGVLIIGGIDRQQLQRSLEAMGFFAPIIYLVFYTIGTLLILPSTPLNLTGGGNFWSLVGDVMDYCSGISCCDHRFYF